MSREKKKNIKKPQKHAYTCPGGAKKEQKEKKTYKSDNIQILN